MKDLAKYVPESKAASRVININLRKPAETTAMQQVARATADNFPQILSLVHEIIDIQRCKLASETQIKLLAEKRKDLSAEAEAYVLRKHADTNDIVARMNSIREMLQDFYRCDNREGISSEDFRMIITSIIENFGAR